MIKTRLHKLICLFALAIVLCACSKETFFENQSDKAILFGVDKSSDKSRVSGNDFDDQDKIGVYAYFNNWYYVDEDNNMAESVIFSNKELTVNVNEGVTTATYSPVISWSFSTLYGDAPHLLDVVAYYPYEASDNLTLSNSVDATMTYKYSNNTLTYDFMVASVDYYQGTAVEFRDFILAKDYIPLTFIRKMASLDLVVANISTSELAVSSIEFHVDKTYSTLSSTEPFDTWTWSDQVSNDVMTLSFDEPVSLSSARESVVDSGVYFPDGTELSEIVFNFSGSSFASYSWHPHIEQMEANTPLVIYLDLDPVRLN